MNEVRVYSLVGKSGTGKSYRAEELCIKYGIDSIIDDGLFISKGRLLAGASAKRQNTKIRAIKTALFTDDAHRRSVAERIEQESPDSVLVIGTSDRMVDLITGRLGLPAPETRFDIEDITTPEERVTAYKQRNELGKHVIPVPTFQIKTTFSGYFYHPIRTFLGMADTRRARGADAPENASANASGNASDAVGETAHWDRSVVRPTYSYLGDFTISDKAVRDIVLYVSAMIGDIHDLPLILIHAHKEGAIVEIGAVMRYGVQIVEAARKLQIMSAEHIESMTSINVIAVDVEIQGLAM
jgi:uncharacterized alkaline shock family protein YloU